MRSYFMPHAPVFLPTIGISEAPSVKQTYDAMHKAAKEIKEIAPDTIIVISPHGPRFSDALAIYNQQEYRGDLNIYGDFDNTYKFEKDDELIKAILEKSDANNMRYHPLSEAEFNKFGVETALDHGVLVPLYFITRHYTDFKLVCISDGDFDYAELIASGQIIKLASEALNRNVVVIASGDLSHTLSNQGPYEYNSAGPVVDNSVTAAINESNLDKLAFIDEDEVSAAQICGLNTLMILLGLYDTCEYESKLLSYEGPFGVGYGVGKFKALAKTLPHKRSETIIVEMKKKALLKQKSMHSFCNLALKVISYKAIHGLSPRVSIQEEGIIIDGEIMPLSKIELSELKRETNGIFVSVKKNGKLRGCIGQYASETPEPLYKQICYYAQQAAFKDPRFDAVTPDELPLLTVSIDLLSDLFKVMAPTMYDVKTYGIFVRKGDNSGILLPDISGVDNPVDQIRIAARKAGITVEGIEEYFRFTVERLI